MANPVQSPDRSPVLEHISEDWWNAQFTITWKRYFLDSQFNVAANYTFTGTIRFQTTVMFRSTQNLTNGAAANVGTLNNAPAAGNPTKWIPIDDNGTTRFIPAW